jgi:hypothetical protein
LIVSESCNEVVVCIGNYAKSVGEEESVPRDEELNCGENGNSVVVSNEELKVHE